MAKDRATFFEGGIPTEPDVTALRKHFPDSEMKPGKAISYYEVADIIEATPDSNRFRSVTTQWRKHFEKDTGLVIDCPRDGTFVVCKASQVLNLSRRKFRSASRATRRSIVLSKRVDRNALNADERKQLDYTRRVSGILAAAMQTASKATLPTIEDMTTRKEETHEAV